METTLSSGQVKTLFYMMSGWFRCQITAGNSGVTRIELEPQTGLQSLFGFMTSGNDAGEIKPSDKWHWPVVQQIQEYLNGTRRDFTAQIGTITSDMQNVVLEAVRKIPYGRIATYEELAMQIGKTGMAKQVKMAIMHNPLPLLIPCHRVVKNPDDIGVYVAGERIKYRLLQLESFNRNKDDHMALVL